MFIDITGVDGCGKSTVSAELAKKLCASGKTCKVFHGYQPRKNMYMLGKLCILAGIPFEEISKYNTLGMAAALMDIFCNTTALFSENTFDFDYLIAEKYIKDSVVYMPLLGGDVNLAGIYEKALPKPDLRIILDVDADIAMKRIIERSKQTGKLIQEKEKYEIIQKARLHFCSFANEPNTMIVDATQPLECVLSQVFDLIFKS